MRFCLGRTVQAKFDGCCACSGGFNGNTDESCAACRSGNKVCGVIEYTLAPKVKLFAHTLCNSNTSSVVMFTFSLIAASPEAMSKMLPTMTPWPLMAAFQATYVGSLPFARFKIFGHQKPARLAFSDWISVANAGHYKNHAFVQTYGYSPAEGCETMMILNCSLAGPSLQRFYLL